MTDLTINSSGWRNRIPVSVLPSDGNTALIDELIRDKWLDPEARLSEIALTYKGQRDANWRQILETRRRLDAEAYAKNWIDNFLHP